MGRSLTVRPTTFLYRSPANSKYQRIKKASHLASSSESAKLFKAGILVLQECQLVASVDSQFQQTWLTAASLCPVFQRTAPWSLTSSCWRSSKCFATLFFRLLSVCSSDQTIVDITSETCETTLLYCKNSPTPLT